MASRKRLVYVDTAALIRKYGSSVLGGLGIALWLVALYLLSLAAQNSAAFEEWLPYIVVINITDIIVVLFIFMFFVHIVVVIIIASM